MGIDKEAAGVEETATQGNERAEEWVTEVKGNGDEQGGRESFSFVFLHHPRAHPDWMETRLLFSASFLTHTITQNISLRTEQKFI